MSRSGVLADIQGLYRVSVYRYWSRPRALSATRFGQAPRQFFLVSYPKSGNTWVRFLLAHLLNGQGEELTLRNLWRLIPDSHDRQQRAYMLDRQSSFGNLPYQVVKAHDPFLPFYWDKQVIYLVRDGRDVLTSYYHYHNARVGTGITLSDLIESREPNPMGTWSSHVLSWMQRRGKRKLYVKYEDLISDTAATLSRMLAFMDWSPDQRSIADAVKRSSFRQLKQVEATHGWLHDSKAKAGEQRSFFRKGEVGDWRNTFTDADATAFWRRHGKGMRALGYT